ncbi:hypothetical protein [Thiocapsa rosea]|uniref:hypothetical protein n=1 Tax=Thiocapsa rosea TaxID=69360 RepID=UPI001FECA342
MTDRLEGECVVAIARFHLNPQIQADGEGMQGTLSLPDGQSVRWSIAKGAARLVPNTWHPEFGVSLPAQCLEVGISDGECTMVFDRG